MDAPVIQEITLYDKTFTIREFAVIQCAALFYFFIGATYWGFRKLKRRLNPTLSAIHTLVTVGSLMVYSFSILINEFFAQDYTAYFELNETVIMLLLPLMAVAQVLYLINVIIGIKTPYHQRRHKKKY
ncbi:hypothetical protein [uncultured Flavobacterium sp.]|uniref:hypothetical protein n=1 Tax=uncultured Flavobacterium sp. TaxID=165435 RepID=UPI0026009E59|nr:hypothetical protein [uncultured Flavobacterium sp.]